MLHSLTDLKLSRVIKFFILETHNKIHYISFAGIHIILLIRTEFTISENCPSLLLPHLTLKDASHSSQLGLTWILTQSINSTNPSHSCITQIFYHHAISTSKLLNCEKLGQEDYTAHQYRPLFHLPLTLSSKAVLISPNMTTIANICWIIENAREFQKNISFCFIDYAKAFDCVDHNKLWKILKAMQIPDHLIFLLRNLYVGQGTAVRNGHGTTDWFQIVKGVCQGCILSPCLFNLYAEYIMRNLGWKKHGLEEAQSGIKIARRNINNLRYADDTTLRAESEEELKILLMKVKEESEKWAQNSTFRKRRSWHLVPSLRGK